MKNTKPTPYIPPDLEIFKFECSDILTASGGEEETNGYVPDDNVDYVW